MKKRREKKRKKEGRENREEEGNEACFSLQTRGQASMKAWGFKPSLWEIFKSNGKKRGCHHNLSGHTIR